MTQKRLNRNVETSRPAHNISPQPGAVRLHIERLVLDGLPLAAHEAPRLRAAVAAELSRLLSATPVAELPAGGAVAALPGAEVKLTPGASPAFWGTQIARSIHSSLCAPAAQPAAKETSSCHSS